MGRSRLRVTDVAWLPEHVGPVVLGVATEGVLRLGDELVLLRPGRRGSTVVVNGMGRWCRTRATATATATGSGPAPAPAPAGVAYAEPDPGD